MPRCKDCTHYQSKSFPEMPWNYECKIGHDMPEYGDTNSCSDYEESYVLGLERGWSYREEKEREGKTYQDDLDRESESSSNESDNPESQQNNYYTYSSGYSSSSNSGGLKASLIAIVVIFFIIPALYFIILNPEDPFRGMFRYLEQNILLNIDRYSLTRLLFIFYSILMVPCILFVYLGVPLSIVFLCVYVVYIAILSICKKT